MNTMKNPYALLLIVLSLSGLSNAQDPPNVVLSPALYIVSAPPVQPDSTTVPNGLKWIGSLPVSIGNFYGEIRYNYDADHTLGLYGGRTVSVGTRLVQSFTTQLGFLFGDFQGASFQVYYQLATRCFELNSQQQYSVSWQRGNSPFYYTWSDAQWKAGRHLRVGASVQVSRSNTDSYTDGGLLIGYKMPHLYVSLYHFNAYRPSQSYAVLAIQYDLPFGRSGKRRTELTPTPHPFH